MTLLALVAIIFFGFATYTLTCAFVDIPTKKTSRMMMLARKQQGVKAEKLLDVYITKIAGLIAPYLKLDTPVLADRSRGQVLPFSTCSVPSQTHIIHIQLKRTFPKQRMS